MTAPTSGPCTDWVDADDVFDCSPCSGIALADRNAVLAASAATAASRILFLLSDRKYPGTCTSMVRPCRKGCWSPAHASSIWGSCSCGAQYAPACGCGAGVSQILLGSEPVIAITSVRVDGSLVAASSYRIDDYRWLVRTDGESWPSSQDLSADPATEADTFQVVFTHGRAVPEDGILGAKALACQFYQACAADGDCVLPQTVQSIVRQGVEIGFENVDTLFTEGRTGVYAADLFLGTERYADKNLQTVIASPDFGPTVRKTTG